MTIKIFVIIFGGAALGVAHKSRVSLANKRAEVIEGENKTIMRLYEVPKLKLRDLRDSSITRLAPLPTNGLRLLLFISVADCSSCVAILSGVNDLPNHLHNPNLRIDSIFVRTSECEAKAFVAEQGKIQPQLYHPYLDMNDNVEHLVTLPGRTPVLVLVDNDYNVRMILGASNNADAQANFFKTVAAIASESN